MLMNDLIRYSSGEQKGLWSVSFNLATGQQIELLFTHEHKARMANELLAEARGAWLV